ncbi:MAG TPA: DNA repair protein RecO [Burkholderiales bacterium]
MNKPEAQAARASAERGRHEAEPAFVLHSYPFSETSLIVEAFTRNFGRMGLVARGARRPKSGVRGLLLPFQPLLLSWSGKAELRTLTRAEWQGGQPPLAGLALISGFYLNELLLKLLARDDPHERLFDYYQASLAGLSRGRELPAVLRRLELRLLAELGYGLLLDREADGGAPVIPERTYAYVPERGPVPVADGGAAETTVELRGKTLLDMARDDYSDPVTQVQSKTLMRLVINLHLGGATLHTRQLLRDLKEL